MSDTSPATAARRCPRWLSALLVVSLAANVAVAGVIGGRLLSRMEDRDPEIGRYNTRILALLPEARRDAARAIMLEARRGDGSLDAQMIEATRAVVQALEADPFVPEALAEAMAARIGLFRVRVEGGNRALVEIAGMLTREERARLAAGMLEMAEQRVKRFR